MACALATVLMLTAVIDAPLLRYVIRRLQSGQAERKVWVELEVPADDYYPLPGSSEFASYFEARRFFRILDGLGRDQCRGDKRGVNQDKSVILRMSVGIDRYLPDRIVNQLRQIGTRIVASFDQYHATIDWRFTKRHGHHFAGG